MVSLQVSQVVYLRTVGEEDYQYPDMKQGLERDDNLITFPRANV